MHFVVNGVAIKTPTTFKVEYFNITNMERLSNATMVGDLIARKRKFYFTYDALSGVELDRILSAINSDELFFNMRYDDGGHVKTATVYVGSIPAELHYMSDRSTVWKNVTFNLIER